MSPQTAAPELETADDEGLRLHGIVQPPERPPPLLRLAVVTGVALVVLQVVYLLCVIYSGLALQKRETLVGANALYRIGLSFSGHVHLPTGLCLLAAAALLATPALTQKWPDFASMARNVALVVIQVLALLTVIGAVLAVRSTVFFLPPLAHHLTSSQRWELASYVAATAGMAAIALAAAVGSMPRFLSPAEETAVMAG